MTLTAERLRELLDYDSDTGVFIWKKISTRNQVLIGSVAGSLRSDGRIRITIDGRRYLAHRLVWLYSCGEWPNGDLDHKDENPSNNRLANLRLATRAQNTQNQSKPRVNSTSGYLGISRHKNRFRARIRVGEVYHSLGLFDTPEEANQAYLTAKAVLHPFWADK